MPGEHTFYDGSTVLKGLEPYIGVEVDKINLVLCMVSSLPIAFYYQRRLSPDKVSRQTRTAVPLVIGLSFCYFCFGRAVKHLLANSLISYALIYLTPVKYVHKVVFIFSMSYLVWIHFYRWLILSSYSLDITGPMMVGVQKITTLAFSLHDGAYRKEEELTPLQKKEAIKEVPTLLDYMSFLFNFQTAMTGPLNYYTDYSEFIEGAYQKEIGWSNTKAALQKVLQSLVFVAAIVTLGVKYPPEIIVTKEYMEETNVVTWYLTWYIAICLVRANYYFAWIFADAVCNMSGFGYSGKDENDEPQWDLCKSVNPLRVENGQSLKEILDNWNIPTAGWLRRVAYDRAPKKIKTVATYLLSAIWHGVSVGYYLTFLSAALFTPAASTFRRCMRWRFVDDPSKKFFYDLFSNVVSKASLTYLTYPFVMMNLHPSIDVYIRLFFVGHIIALAVQFVLPKFYPPQRKTETSALKPEGDVKLKNGKEL